jgi:C-terminal processing protease CtpA/Prc
MTMAPITVEDPLVVAAVAHKGAAKKAGIVAGDRIVAVDGISVYGRPFMSLTRSFAGTKKSVLKLTIEHASGSSIERKEVSLQRGKVTGLFD